MATLCGMLRLVCLFLLLLLPWWLWWNKWCCLMDASVLSSHVFLLSRERSSCISWSKLFSDIIFEWWLICNVDILGFRDVLLLVVPHYAACLIGLKTFKIATRSYNKKSKRGPSTKFRVRATSSYKEAAKKKSYCDFSRGTSHKRTWLERDLHRCQCGVDIFRSILAAM